MAYEYSTQRYRNWYAKLLRLYPKPYRKRFDEGMEQTFNDLCRERKEAGKGLFAFAGALLVGAGLTYVLATRKTGNFTYRAAVVVALATAFAQALVTVIALIAELGSPLSGPGEILILNGFFIVLWVGSALLFRRTSAMGSKWNRRLK